MNTQLKVLLIFNAIMFLIAGVLEWQYYTAHEQAEPQTDYSRSDLISIHARSQSPPVDLDELHRSFRKKIPEPVNISLGTGLIPCQVARQAQLIRIPGDGSGGELSNAAVILFCYNRYTCNSSNTQVYLATNESNQAVLIHVHVDILCMHARSITGCDAPAVITFCPKHDAMKCSITCNRPACVSYFS